MKLSSLLPKETIRLNLEARNIRDAVSEILEAVGQQYFEDSVDRLREAILHREDQASTAVSNGIAVPHARIPNLREFYLLVGIPAKPMDDKGPDGSPVDLVLVIAADPDKNTVMLQTLAAIGALGQMPEQLQAVKSASSPDEVWQAIDASGVTVKTKLTARDVMRESPVIARSEMALRELLDALFEHGVYEAPVCDESGALIGSVTAEEIIEGGFPDYMSRIPNLGFLKEYEPFEQFFQREAAIKVEDVMNEDPLVVDAETSMIQVVMKLKQEHQHYAYVQEEGRLLGVIDRNDVISRVLRI